MENYRYYICAFGYDSTDRVTEHDLELGDYDTFDEAYRCFAALQSECDRSPYTRFKDWPPDVKYWAVVLEQCIEDDDSIECVDIRSEFTVEKQEKEMFTKKVLQEPYNNREDSLWYGGVLSRYEKGKYTVEIAAYGDVRCEATDKDGKFLFEVKDKNNSGDFYMEAQSFIRNDQELWDAINGRNPKIMIDLQDNNWFEACVYENGTFLDSFVIEEEEKISNAADLDEIEFDRLVQWAAKKA